MNVFMQYNCVYLVLFCIPGGGGGGNLFIVLHESKWYILSPASVHYFCIMVLIFTLNWQICVIFVLLYWYLDTEDQFVLFMTENMTWYSQENDMEWSHFIR